MKIKEFLCVIACIAVLSFSTGILIGSIATRKIVHVDLDINNEQTTVDVPPKYPFLESRVSDYICSLSAELEKNRLKYLETKDKNDWKKLIVNLPESWLQTRTVTMNYENLLNMYHQRKNHKLTEWHKFCEWIEESLPYAKELIIGGQND